MACILIIDDDEQIRKTLRATLEREGHNVVEAPDGYHGVQLFRRKGADLVITDIVMPNKEGLETIRELREDCPDVKIVAISGGGVIEPRFYLYLAQKSGAVRTLAKPFNRSELLAAVDDLLA